jgi:hypothetical protein
MLCPLRREVSGPGVARLVAYGQNLRLNPPGFFTQGRGVVNSVVVRTVSRSPRGSENYR